MRVCYWLMPAILIQVIFLAVYFQQVPRLEPRDNVEMPRNEKQSQAPSPLKGTVAYALTFTQCPEGNKSIEVFDAPAVLAHSIFLNSYRNGKSAYDYHLIAFVHPLAQNCTQNLPDLGFDVRIKEEPVKLHEINETLKLHGYVQRNGCCGIREFMKLYVYTLTNYDIAVQLDCDLILLQPLDDLYDAMRANDVSNISLLHPLDDPKRQTDFFFTRDYIQQSKKTTDRTRYAVQGGFFVVRPNATIFQELVDTILVADFGPHLGWGKKGYIGYYGSAQIQGFMSYFYGQIYPHRAAELHPCIYNTLQVFDPIGKDGTCRFDIDMSPCLDCNETAYSDILLTHYTSCYKPWWCPMARTMQLCRDFHASWFRTRQSLELSRGMEVPTEEGSNLYERFYGYCTEFKREHYVPMNLTVNGTQTSGAS